MLKKFLSIALSCGMVLTLLPAPVFAWGVTGGTKTVEYSSRTREFSFWGDADGLVYETDAIYDEDGITPILEDAYGKPMFDAEKEQYREALKQSYVNLNFDKDILKIEEGETGIVKLGSEKYPVAYTIVVPEGTTITMSESSADMYTSISKTMWRGTLHDGREDVENNIQFPDTVTLNSSMPEIVYDFSFSCGQPVYVDAKIKIRIENNTMESHADHEPIRLGTRDDVIVLKIDSVETHVFGEKVTKDAAPVIRNGRTMLPIRFVVEALGGTVGWDETQQEVAIKLNTTEIGVGIGSKTAQVGDKEVNLDSPAYVENGRTYLPLRFVAENLGAEVLWDNETREVIIIPDK